MHLGQVAPCEVDDVDAACHRIAPLAADRLPLPRGEGVEEILEVTVAGIEEMELLVGALEEPGLAEQRPFRLGQERRVYRRDAVALGQGLDPPGEDLAVVPGSGPGRTRSRRPVTGVNGTETWSFG
jgi:hypothetical protein